MTVKQKQIWLLFLFVVLLLTLALAIASCGGTPTPKPQPTFALEVSPGTEVQVGKGVAIVAKVEPLEKLDLKWSVSGKAGGKLNTDTGEQVVYTASKEGMDIVVAEGTTASGVPVRQTVSLTVVREPVAQAPTSTFSPTPTPTPTATPTDTPIPTPTPTVTTTDTPTPTSTPPVTPTNTPKPKPTDTPVLLQLEITGTVCKPNNDPVDMDGNKVFLPARHFDRFGNDQSGFWATVINPQTGDQIDAQIIAFRDSHDSDMRTWDKCDFALKKTMRLALGGDLDEVANMPFNDRPPRTLRFIYTVQTQD